MNSDGHPPSPIKLVPPVREPDASLVAYLESLLARAMTGEMVAMVGAAFREDRSFEVFLSQGALKTAVVTLGALRFVERDLFNEVENGG